MASKRVISEYELRKNFNAPRINLGPNEPMSYKGYAAGSKVRGFIYENTDAQIPLPPDLQMIITEDKMYAIPMTAINHIKDVSIDGKAVPETAAEKAAKGDLTLPEEIRNKLNAIKSSDIIGNVIRNSKQSSNGLLLGAVAGAVTAMIMGKSVVGFAALGAIAGGYAGYKYSQYKNTQKVKDASEINDSKNSAPEITPPQGMPLPVKTA